jgi:FAD/FMN-containing dehydrogenase
MIGRRDFLHASGGLLAAGALSRHALGRLLGDACPPSTLTDGALANFRSAIHGQVILPTDADYASARLLFHRRFDQFPLMVVRVADESDVSRTIDFARTNGIRLAVRSGGHSYIGASGGSGIVLDLSLMSLIQDLGGGHFRIGSGTQLQRVYGHLRCNGDWTLPAGSCPTVCFGGLALGGGFGYRQRSLGLTCDRIRAVRIARADGTFVDAAPDGDSDLYWALRGGGGNSFGVATTIDVEAAPYRTLRVYLWRWPLAAVGDALARLIEVQQADLIPRSVTGAVVCNSYAAATNPSTCLFLAWGNGPESELDFTRELLTGSGGVPMVDGSFTASDDAVPPCSPNEMPPRAWYRAKSAMVYGAVPADTGPLIREWMERRVNGSAPITPDDYASLNLFTVRGAVGDVAPDATAFAHRQALLEVQFLGFVTTPSPVANVVNDDWIQGFYRDVYPRLSAAGAGAYVNYPDEDLTEAQWSSQYWGANYARLRQTKQRVDPTDFFRGRQTVRLASR